MEQSKARPVGVIIVAILIIINGIILIGGGAFGIYILTSLANQVTGPLNEDLSSILGNLSSEIGDNLTEGDQNVSLAPTPITSTILAIGMTASAIGIAIGVACLFLAWGLFRGKGWAWIITVILSGISIVFGIFGLIGGNFLNIINIIISGVILYYLYRPNVKAYFGRLNSV
ncbi:MAG TPA: hypothetical protein VH500_17700 [Nitrososphaeraceae archaeon]